MQPGFTMIGFCLDSAKKSSEIVLGSGTESSSATQGGSCFQDPAARDNDGTPKQASGDGANNRAPGDTAGTQYERYHRTDIGCHFQYAATGVASSGSPPEGGDRSAAEVHSK